MVKIIYCVAALGGMLRFPHAHNTVKGQEGDVVTRVVTPLLT